MKGLVKPAGASRPVYGTAGDSAGQGQPPGMSLAERRGGNRSVIPDTTRREAEMSTAQEHGNIPSTAVEFAPRSARRWRRRTPMARATSPARCDSGCRAATRARPRFPLRPTTLPGPLRHRAGWMTRSARSWPSAARNGSRFPMSPGWSPASPDCAWRLTRCWTCGGATTARQGGDAAAARQETGYG
jgi:hypothetical protein